MLLIAIPGFGQILTNGSLEGIPGTRTPDNWISCLASSTVDIQPGTWGVTKPPQHGDTYIDMVCRGSNYTANPATSETCEELAQVLNNPLEAGKCYRVEMYMSIEPTFGTAVGITQFTGPINIQVSGGTSLCSRDEIIVEYDNINHEDWRRYVSYFTPDQDLNAIWLEGRFTGPDLNFGHVLVDNLVIEEVNAPEVHELVLCENESINLNAFLAADAQAFDWSTGASTPEIEINENGTYTVDITLGECVIRETFEVTLQEAPVVELTTDLMICPGEEIILDAFDPAADFLWQDGSTGSTFTATDAGTYSVTLTIDQCVTSHTVTILLDNCEAILEMPNAFTPNGDQKNDLFIPIRISGITSMRTVIYNRWGENIYTTQNLNIEWNGHLPSDEPAPASTYYWRISYTDLFGENHSQKGTVTIMR